MGAGPASQAGDRGGHTGPCARLHALPLLLCNSETILTCTFILHQPHKLPSQSRAGDAMCGKGAVNCKAPLGERSVVISKPRAALHGDRRYCMDLLGVVSPDFLPGSLPLTQSAVCSLTPGTPHGPPRLSWEYGERGGEPLLIEDSFPLPRVWGSIWPK